MGPARAQRRGRVRRLDPIVRGWSAYTGRWYPGGYSRRWTLHVDGSPTSGPSAATRRSRSTGSSDKYFGRFNRSRNDRWVFGDRDSGAYLLKFAWTNISRHQLVKGTASPDDPCSDDYWSRASQDAHTSANGQDRALLWQPVRKGSAPTLQVRRSSLEPNTSRKVHVRWIDWFDAIEEAVAQTPLHLPTGRRI